jgi:hypothetical protein
MVPTALDDADLVLKHLVNNGFGVRKYSGVIVVL